MSQTKAARRAGRPSRGALAEPLQRLASPPGPARLRIALIADGDLGDRSTNSGSARGLAEALAANPAVELIPLVGRLPRWQRIAVAVTHLRPGRQAWRRAAVKSRMTVTLRSRLRDTQLESLSPPADVVLHLRNLYLPCHLPYATFIDTTVAVSQDGWSGWRLPSGLASWRTRTERDYLTGAVQVLAAGQQVARSAIEDVGAAPARVEVVGGGTNPLPPPSGAPQRKPHDVVFVGVDWRRKGGDVLLRAWPTVVAELPDAVLHLVGSGPPGGGASRAATGVVAHGRVTDRAELAAILAGASVFCLPALFEPYGLAVQEAMASGLAVVVSDVGELPFLVGSTGAGMVVPAGDPVLLSHTLVHLLSDDDLRATLAARGRAAAAAMSWSAVGDRVVAALTDVLPTGARRGDP